MSEQFVGNFDESMLHDMSEMSKRYKDTYLFCRTPNHPKWALYNVEHVDDDHVYLRNDKHGSVVLSSTSAAELNAVWPDSGFFNFEKSILHVARVPDRQWKRGPCSKNLRISDPILRLFHVSTSKFSMSALEASYDDKNYTIKQALALINKKELVARALSRQWALSLPTWVSDDEYLLWYQHTPVAVVNSRAGTITCQYEHVKQELQDFIRDHEANTWTLN